MRIKFWNIMLLVILMLQLNFVNCGAEIIVDISNNQPEQDTITKDDLSEKLDEPETQDSLLNNDTEEVTKQEDNTDLKKDESEVGMVDINNTEDESTVSEKNTPVPFEEKNQAENSVNDEENIDNTESNETQIIKNGSSEDLINEQPSENATNILIGENNIQNQNEKTVELPEYEKLMAWYADSNREKDTFVLSDNISITMPVSFERNSDDLVALTIECGKYSIIFEPISPRFSLIFNDNNLSIFGNKTVLDIKNGKVNMLCGSFTTSGNEAVCINSNGFLGIYGADISANGTGSIAVNSEFVTNLETGSITASGENSVALSIGANSEISKQSFRNTFDKLILEASGDNAAVIQNMSGCADVWLDALNITAKSGAYAIISNSDVNAIYSKIAGDIHFINGKLNTYFCELSDRDFEDEMIYTVDYTKEEIIINDKKPSKDKISIINEQGKKIGEYLVPINWDGVYGTLETFVSAPVSLKKIAYEYELSGNETADNITKWYDNAAEGDIYTLSGDIIIDSPITLSGNKNLTIDTGEFAIILRNKLLIENGNIEITGKGEKIGVICIDSDDYGGSVVMPNGGKITAENGLAILSVRNCFFSGNPEISSIKLMCGADTIVGANITGKVESTGKLILAGCIVTGEIAAEKTEYVMSKVNIDAIPLEISRYTFDNERIVYFEDETKELLPKKISVNVYTGSKCYTLLMPVEWDSSESYDVGTYKINGKIEELDGVQPDITLDVINKDKITVLKGISDEEIYKKMRIYFPIAQEFLNDNSKFALIYAQDSFENNPVFGTIATNTQNGMGYDLDDVKSAKDGYGVITLNSKNEYELLTEDAYCFRVKMFNGNNEYYTDEQWFPKKIISSKPPETLPSVPEEKPSVGGRGGGNRYTPDTNNQKNVTSAQVNTLLKSGKAQTVFIIDSVKAILTKSALKELSSGFSVYAKKTSDNSFTVYLKVKNKNLKSLKNKITIMFPYETGENLKCNVNGNEIKNVQYADGYLTFETSALGDFVISKVRKTEISDTPANATSDLGQSDTKMETKAETVAEAAPYSSTNHIHVDTVLQTQNDTPENITVFLPGLTEKATIALNSIKSNADNLLVPVSTADIPSSALETMKEGKKDTQRESFSNDTVQNSYNQENTVSNERKEKNESSNVIKNTEKKNANSSHNNDSLLRILLLILFLVLLTTFICVIIRRKRK